jgi:predicted nucleic acid-binding protein
MCLNRSIDVRTILNPPPLDLTASLAIAASRISLAHNLPMADSIILATAREGITG